MENRSNRLTVTSARETDFFSKKQVWMAHRWHQHDKTAIWKKYISSENPQERNKRRGFEIESITGSSGKQCLEHSTETRIDS